MGGLGGFGGGGGGGGTPQYGGAGGFGGGGGGSGFSIATVMGGTGGFGGGDAGAGKFGGGGAGLGGAIFMYGGTLTATNCTFTGNSTIAGTAGGAPAAAGKAFGGAIFNRNGTCTITNCTVSSNTAADGGRGIYNLADGAAATSAVTLKNTIVGESGATIDDFNGSQISTGTSNSDLSTNNIVGFAVAGNGTIIGLPTVADPKLATLADNGGPTQTMALLTGSPAIDNGSNVAAPTTDQRGDVRPNTSDIGAFEFGGEPVVLSVGVPADGTYHIGQNLTFTVNFNSVVNVTGAPEITVTVGVQPRQAGFTSGSGSKTLTFTYSVFSGDQDTDGIALPASILLNGGTIKDNLNANAVTTLNNVPSTAGVLVNGIAPIVTLNTASLAVNATTLTINGTGFDATTFGNNSVVFNSGATGTVTGSTATTLTVTSLSGLTCGSLTAIVTTDGNGSGAAVQVATVVPVVTTNTATIGSNATTLTINGFGFSLTPETTR